MFAWCLCCRLEKQQTWSNGIIIILVMLIDHLDKLAIGSWVLHQQGKHILDGMLWQR